MSADARRLDAVTAESAVRDLALRVDPAVEFQVPRDAHIDAALAAVDALIDQGQPQLALDRATTLVFRESAVAVPHEFLRAERVSRAQLAIGDGHLLSDNRDDARGAYEAIWSAEAAHPVVRHVVALARERIESLMSERSRLNDEIDESVRLGTFDRWCDQHSRLRDMTILSDERLWGQIEYDGRALIETRLDPATTQVLVPPSALPGSVFQVAADAAPSSIPLRLDSLSGDRIPAALARPVIETMLTVRMRLLVIETGLTLTGQSAATMPVFRYEYLRDRAYLLIDQIVGLDERTAAVETRLDDLTAVLVRIAAQSAQAKERVAAISRDVTKARQQRETLLVLEKAAAAKSKELQAAASGCETEWWECVVGAVLVVTSQVLGVSQLFGGVGQASVTSFLLDAGVHEAAALASFLAAKSFSCSDINKAHAERNAAVIDLQKAMEANKREMQHLELEMDRRLTELKGVDEQCAQAQTEDATRGLSTVTLAAMRSHYRRIRDDLVARARELSDQAQTAFNFEEDAGLTPIRKNYLDESRKGYASGETLRADLQRLEQFRLTTRRTKRLQLSHVVSLRQQHPMSFMALRTAGVGRVAIDMADVDRAFPGTYLQRIREARVEVLTSSGAVAAQGYLSNEGLSSVRFQDRGDRSPWLGAEVSPDPDPAIAALCFKHARQIQPAETAAFSDFQSHLFVDRSIRTQHVERNFFENLGVETTWTIELLPGQSFSVSEITDVRLHVQFDAFFDDILKGVLDGKRHAHRRETATFSVRELAADPAADLFTQPLTVAVRRHRLPVPALDKRITEVGFAIKPRRTPVLSGAATLTASIDGSAPATLVTDATGIVATAEVTPTGSGIAALALAARGKSVHAPWTLELVDLPAGLGKADIEDVFLLFEYDYVTT